MEQEALANLQKDSEDVAEEIRIGDIVMIEGSSIHDDVEKEEEEDADADDKEKDMYFDPNTAPVQQK